MPQRRDVGTRYAIEIRRYQYGQMAWCETGYTDLPTAEAAETAIANRFDDQIPTRIVEYVTSSRVIRD